MKEFKPITEKQLQGMNLDNIEVGEFTEGDLEGMDLKAVQEELEHENGKKDKDIERIGLLTRIRDKKAREVFRILSVTLIQEELECQRGKEFKDIEFLELLLQVRCEVVESLGVRELEEALQSAEQNLSNDPEYYKLLLQTYEKMTGACEDLFKDFEDNPGEEDTCPEEEYGNDNKLVGKFVDDDGDDGGDNYYEDEEECEEDKDEDDDEEEDLE